MKRTFLGMLVLLALLTLSACGSSSSNKIVGKWYNPQYDTYFDFESDGSYSFGSANGTYEIEGTDTLILNQPSGSSTRFTYTIDGDELRMVSGDYEYLSYKEE